MVSELDTLDEIRGFLTFENEEVREKTEEAKALEDAERDVQEVSEKVLTVDGEDLIEKFRGKQVKEFLPCDLLAANANDQYLEYLDFDQCVDEFFSQAEKQKDKARLYAKEQQIYAKMNRIQEDQEKRIQGLQREQDLSDFKALLLQRHEFEAQAIIDIISVMKSSGIPWTDINRMIKEEQHSNNPLASLIYNIDFERNYVSLILQADDA